MKNSFKALRTKLRSTENKLNNANKIIELHSGIYESYINELNFKNKSIFRLQLLSAGLAFVCNVFIALYFIK